MSKKELSISAIREGTVIDHIPAERTVKVADILKLQGHKGIISIVSNLKSKSLGKKGIVKVGGKDLTQEEVDKIAIIAPNATVNIIGNFEVKKKLKVTVPKVLENIVKCPNPECITNHESTGTRFFVTCIDPFGAKCEYCERIFEREDITLL
jgi:aspartate carbamoyltransferase regulatory subunit